MENAINAIKNIVESYAPEYLSKIKRGNTTQELFDILEQLTCAKEATIKLEKEKPYTTDTVEIEFTNFVTRIISYVLTILIQTESETEKCLFFDQLFVHRHFGYAFFTKEHIDESVKKFTSVEDNYKILYLSMSEYFNNYIGRLSNNELAIEMLCAHYEDVNFSVDEKHKIASSLYTHVCYAGSPSDSGYAYNGITTIIKYMSNIPKDIILMVIGQYHFYQVFNNAIYRKQIFHLIEYSEFSSSEKNIYKFFFLDSVILLNTIYLSINKIAIENNAALKEFDKIELMLLSNEKLSEKEISVSMSNSEKAFVLVSEFDEGKAASRIIESESDILLCISLNVEEKNISIGIGNKRNESQEEPFDKDDWMLNDFQSRAFREKLQAWVNISQKNVADSNETFSFSFVYLNNYHGLTHQLFSFDNQYKYDYIKKQICTSDNKGENLDTHYFYGKNIYSLSCIVGKNGTGKTTLVDFLTDVFFKTIYIYDNSTSYGISNSTEFVFRQLMKDFGFDNSSDMLVIFEFCGETYRVSNIEGIEDATGQVGAYQQGVLSHFHDYSKVIYFSGKTDYSNIFAESNYQDEVENKNIDEENKGIMRSLQDYQKVDLSEEADIRYKQQSLMQKKYHEKLNAYSPISINKALIYQLSFLSAYTDEELQTILWSNFTRENLKIKGQQNLADITKWFNSENALNAETSNFIKEILHDVFCGINHFSSGQYAKFSFLSKLFWCIKGQEQYGSKLEKIAGSKNIFNDSDSITLHSSALIFIDEGDVYYHPEWQRQYIKTLTELVESLPSETHLQIVITTNSPFIISDIVSSDIIYLTEADCPQKSFGQNIHTLLKHNFFMRSTIGEFANDTIKFIASQVSQAKEHKSLSQLSKNVNRKFNVSINKNTVSDYLKSVINNIGEEVYRDKLLSMLDDMLAQVHDNTISDLRKLKEQRRLLDEQIKYLERKE